MTLPSFWKFQIFFSIFKKFSIFQRKISNGPIPFFRFWVYSWIKILWMWGYLFEISKMVRKMVFWNEHRKTNIFCVCSQISKSIFSHFFSIKKIPKKIFWKKTEIEFQWISNISCTYLNTYSISFLCLIQELLDVFHYG